MTGVQENKSEKNNEDVLTFDFKNDIVVKSPKRDGLYGAS